VTSIDLTPEFIEVAKDLTQRAGLADKIEFHTGSALDLPFDGGTFDGVWLQHVNMNIGDKERLFAEIGRVLKPGGRLACHEVVLGEGGHPILPAPWASYPECSFVAPWIELKKWIEAAGMTVSYEKDDTAASIEFFDVMFEKMAGSAPHVGLPVLFGKESLSYLQNAARSLKEDRCRVMQAVATKRG
jgi:ubiquinone/menaquinone biosynthesis C-methylase UbiE